VSRAVLVSLLASLLLVSAAYGGRASTGAARAGEEIALRASFHQGPWTRSLHLKLHKLSLTNFRLCAIWHGPAGATFDCDAAADTALPTGTSLRLEQSPVARALKRPGSPGWGMLGTSGTASLSAVLSNQVTGDKPGTFRYRVTLRNPTGHIVAASNVLTVIWQP